MHTTTVIFRTLLSFAVLIHIRQQITVLFLIYCTLPYPTRHDKHTSGWRLEIHYYYHENMSKAAYVVGATEVAGVVGLRRASLHVNDQLSEPGFDAYSRQTPRLNLSAVQPLLKE